MVSWAAYYVDDEVRVLTTGEFGIVVGVDEDNLLYTVDVDGALCTFREGELG